MQNTSNHTSVLSADRGWSSASAINVSFRGKLIFSSSLSLSSLFRFLGDGVKHVIASRMLSIIFLDIAHQLNVLSISLVAALAMIAMVELSEAQNEPHD